jgi:hypothetical protein
MPLRLVVYDATDTAPVAIPRITRGVDGSAEGTGGLTRFWRLGAGLHRGIGRAGAAFGARTWTEALTWAAQRAEAAGEPIAELQLWGHGGWGYMAMGSERLSVATSRGALSAEVGALARALAPGALVWLRCCSAFGTRAGHELAVTLADTLGARVAGHSYIIGIWQSGTHSVSPGAAPDWDVLEGVERDAQGAPLGAAVSSARAPRTLHCFRPGLPAGW